MVIDSAASELESRIASGNAMVAVGGLGYVGLPLAVGLVRSGYSVLGVDVGARRRSLAPTRDDSLRCRWRRSRWELRDYGDGR